MTKLYDIIEFMNKLCPPSLAFSGDNVGLIEGREDRSIDRVLISLDVDEKVAFEAATLDCDMIISHHPLMFHAIKRLTDSDPMQRTLMSLISDDIALFSAHTNLDCVRGGLNDYLAEKLGVKDTSVIEVVDTIDGIDHGFGRIGRVDEGTTLSDMLSRCALALGTPFVRYVGNPDKKISTVALNCGGGADEMDICIKMGVDLFITGDVKYNPARDAYENGMALIDAGHYETEHIVCELLSGKLSDAFPDVEFIVSKENKPVFNCYTV